MKWLISAFEPFAGAPTNSSLQVLRELEARNSNPRLIFHSPVPVTFKDAWPNLRAKAEAVTGLAGVLALGQAETRSRICLEYLSLNRIDARIRDNAGELPPLGRINSSGPDVLWSNIPWDEFQLTARTERSYSAGTFVCNALMFELMEWAKAHGKHAGFVHVPLYDEGLIPEMENVLEFVLGL
jgi:pyroglutamyl-peptidase